MSASDVVKLTGYTLTSGHYKQYQPKDWVLYGCNDYTGAGSGTWTVIDTKTDNTDMKDVNTDYNFGVSDAGYYKYYKLHITALQKYNTLQLAEMAFSCETCEHSWSVETTVSEATCTTPKYVKKTCSTAGGCGVTVTYAVGNSLGHDTTSDTCSRCEMKMKNTAGAFSVFGAVLNEDFTYENGTLTVKTSTPITIKNTDPATPTNDHIVVKNDVSANITLAGVNISSGCAFKIEDESNGDVTITLAANSENILTSTGYDCAGLQKNSNYGVSHLSGKLTITGTGKLTATGGRNGAGIGGGIENCGVNITISGGVVTATGGEGGAGIGGGILGDGAHITISGGTVMATGGSNVAGIGGGASISCGRYITITGGAVTAKGGKDSGNGAGVGIGGGDASSSNITISGGSVHAVAGDNGVNAIGSSSNGRGAVTPKNAEEHDVYLMTIPNPSNAKVYIDGKEYKPYNHSAIVEENDTNLYPYVTGVHHTVKVGTETSCYHFTGTAMVKCTLKSEYSTDDFGNHWIDCADENCGIQHDFAEHTFNQVVDPKFETGVEANCQHGTEYYKSCICGVKGNETFEGTVLDPTNHVGTLGDWQMTDGEHWKEYSECGCKENKGVHKDESPADHKCDDCGKVLSEHELNDHPEYKADCTHNGMIAHYSCMHCGKLFADENAENEITDSDIVVPATGHSYENGECVNCGARDPEISKVRAFFLDIFKLIVRIIRDFPVWIQTLPEAFMGLFR